MVKRIWLPLVLLAAFQAAFAESEFYNSRIIDRVQETDQTFNEVEITLPKVPNPEQGDWFELYVDNMYRGKPRILLNSLTLAPDGSIRYLFDNRSAAGSSNITAEGFLCVTGTKLLDSEGSKVKTYAYADLVHHRWIRPRKSDWKVLGGQRNNTDRVRAVLYDAFCTDTRPKSSDDLRARLQNHIKNLGVGYGK